MRRHLAFVTVALTFCACNQHRGPSAQSASPLAATQPSPQVAALAMPTPDPLAAAIEAETAAAIAAEGVPRDRKNRSGVGMLNGPCPLPGEATATCSRKPQGDKGPWKAAHILIGWHGSLPGRGADRDREKARELAIRLGHQARQEGANFIAMLWRHGEDPGDGVYTFDAASQRRFPASFTALVRALSVGNVDVVRSRLGYHVVRRLALDEQPPSKPLQTVLTDACPQPGEVQSTCPSPPASPPARVVVRHILVGYKGALARRATARTEAAARELAIELAHRLRRQEASFDELAGRHSDDPGDGVYTVTPDALLVPPFRTLAMGMSTGNIDVVRTRFGYHVVERIE